MEVTSPIVLLVSCLGSIAHEMNRRIHLHSSSSVDPNVRFTTHADQLFSSRFKTRLFRPLPKSSLLRKRLSLHTMIIMHQREFLIQIPLHLMHNTLICRLIFRTVQLPSSLLWNFNFRLTTAANQLPFPVIPVESRNSQRSPC